jgi:hypothetical protein
MLNAHQEIERPRTPEERLVINILLRGVLDYLTPVVSFLKYEDRKDAEYFIEQGDFASLADLVGFCGMAVRDHVMKIKRTVPLAERRAHISALRRMFNDTGR